MIIKLFTELHKCRCERWEEYFVLRNGIECGSGFQNSFGIITRKDNSRELTALLVINRQGAGIDGNFVFGDDNRGMWRYRCGCSHDRAAPRVEENTTTFFIAQWPHDIHEVLTIDCAVWGCCDEAEDIPMLACEFRCDRCTINCELAWAQQM